MANKITQAKTNLVLGNPFFGSLLFRLKCIEDTACDTCYTDGKVIGYNPEFMAKQTVHGLETLLAHEIMHVTNGHAWRKGKRDHEKWNRACDYAINPLLEQSGFVKLDDWLCNPAYAGMPAEKIYDLLPDNESGSDSEGENNGSGQDSQSGENQQTGHNVSPIKMQPGEIRPYPDEDVEQAKVEWKLAVSQAEKTAAMRGKFPGCLSRMVKDLVHEKVDWKSVLHRFAEQAAREDYSYRKPNPRFIHMGFYLPSLYSEKVGKIALCIDTSGSIDEEILGQFQSEVCAIVNKLKPESLLVVYADAAIQHSEEFGPDDMIAFHPKGGGGTDFRPFFEHIDKMEDQPVCALYFTDMYGSFPKKEPGYPVLWISTSEINEAPFGEIVQIEM
ncbi:MAG: hypothetical protein KGI54_05760 [Pseudomonadota bacterium]|nr:hypothetical protein [Pseudomonadota bacterium]